MARISALVHTLNEEQNIRGCLESLLWVDEIVVVDMYSEDKTIDICREYTDKIFFYQRMGYVEPARKFGVEQTTGDWVLVVDADERIPFALSQKILEIVQQNNTNVVEIPRKNYILGKWIEYTRWYPDHQTRFFRKNAVSFSDRIHVGPKVKGNKLTLDAKDETNCMIHYNYTDCAQFVEKLNRYTTFEVDKLLESGEKFSVRKMLWEGFHEFKSRYISNKGYKDGIRGLILSVLMGFYYFLKYAKYWETIEFADGRPEKIYSDMDIDIKGEYDTAKTNQ